MPTIRFGLKVFRDFLNCIRRKMECGCRALATEQALMLFVFSFQFGHNLRQNTHCFNMLLVYQLPHMHVG